MALAVVILVALIVLTAGLSVRRLRDVPGIPVATWIVLVLATALPVYVFVRVASPVPPTHSFTLAALHETTRFEAPPHHDLLITGILDPEAEGGSAGKTNYRISVRGGGEGQECAGSIKRRLDDGGKIDVYGGESIGSGSNNRSAWNEDLQDRCRLRGEGPLSAELALWNGAAAKAIQVDVIPAPMPLWAALVAALVVSFAAVWLESRHEAEKLSGDVAFLAFLGVWLLDATPVDLVQSMVAAVLPAFAVGQLAFAGLGWLGQRVLGKKAPEPVAPGRAPPLAR